MPVPPPRYFAHVSITTPVISALKLKKTIMFRAFCSTVLKVKKGVRVPTDILNRFWIQVQVAVSRFVSETWKPLHGGF
jgi:hypothetical protein